MVSFFATKQDLASKLKAASPECSGDLQIERIDNTTVRVFLDGRMKGQWKQSGAEFDWQAAGHFRSSFRAGNVDIAVRFTVRQCRKRLAA